jgi:hypothetical protein
VQPFHAPNISLVPYQPTSATSCIVLQFVPCKNGKKKDLRSVPGKPRTKVADHHHHARFSSFFRVKRRSIAPIERANPKRIDRADPDTYAARAPLKAELKARRRVARVTSVPDEHILLLPSTGASN